jgi:hypothetical protein
MGAVTLQRYGQMIRMTEVSAGLRVQKVFTILATASIIERIDGKAGN